MADDLRAVKQSGGSIEAYSEDAKPRKSELAVLPHDGSGTALLVEDDGVSFIGKPYTPSALARKVREVLDKA